MPFVGLDMMGTSFAVSVRRAGWSAPAPRRWCQAAVRYGQTSFPRGKRLGPERLGRLPAVFFPSPEEGLAP